MLKSHNLHVDILAQTQVLRSYSCMSPLMLQYLSGLACAHIQTTEEHARSVSVANVVAYCPLYTDVVVKQIHERSSEARLGFCDKPEVRHVIPSTTVQKEEIDF